MRVYLDDERKAPVGWLLVKNAEGCIDLLKAGNVEALSLDHDLAPEHYASSGYMGPSHEPTGHSVVLWMAEHDVWPAHVIVHTMNPVGRDNMLATIRRHAPADTKVEVKIGWCRRVAEEEAALFTSVERKP